MLEYQAKTVLEAVACTCDRCKKRIAATGADEFEWYEKVSLAFQGGYGSIFGDGAKVSIDLCQQCLKETLGTWLRVVPSDGSEGLS